jgi:hypothetical protein
MLCDPKRDQTVGPSDKCCQLFGVPEEQIYTNYIAKYKYIRFCRLQLELQTWIRSEQIQVCA